MKIKKIAIRVSMVGVLFLASAALGEETGSNSASYIGFGVHGGLNYSDYHYSNSAFSDTHQKTGSLFGVHFEGMSLGVFGLRLETNYSTKSYDVGSFATVNHHYLQVPLLFKISPITGPLEVFAEAGPAASLHLSSNVDVLNNSVKYNDDSNTWDFSLIAGVGVAFKFEPFLFALEGRYDYGLKNLSSSNGADIKSRAIQVLAGLTFIN